jgi:hypothetical protein
MWRLNHAAACSPSPVNVEISYPPFRLSVGDPNKLFAQIFLNGVIMSGIEIAGLALGAFPIMLRLLDDYRKASETLDDWWQIRRAYEDWKHDLDYHQMRFDQNSRLILTPMMVDYELEAFLRDPAGSNWKDKRWEPRLKERLSDSYDVVVKIISDVYDVMEKLKKELDNTNLQAHLRNVGFLKQLRISASLIRSEEGPKRQRKTCSEVLQQREYQFPTAKV